jgi:putative tsp protein
MMKGLNVESGIFKRLADVLAVCVSALALSGQAMADVAAPPPSNGQVISNMPTGGNARYNLNFPDGTFYDADRGQIRVPSRPQFNGSSRTSGGHVGNKNLNVSFQDNFGNSAGGQIHTQTRTPGSSTLSKAAGAYAAGSIAGSVLGSSNAQKAAGYLGEGRYGDAAVHAAAAFDVFNIGGGARSLWDAFWASHDGRDIQKEVREAAAKKARDAAAAAEAAEAARREAYDNIDRTKWVSVIKFRDTGEILYVPMKEGRLLGAQGNFTAGEAVPLGAYTLDEKGGLVFEGASEDMFVLPPPTGGSYGERYYYQTSSLMGDQITPEIREKMRNQNKPNLDVRDLLLNQQEIEAILNKKLDALLNSQQANADAITALLNAMWGSGLINTGNTQTNVTGGDAANTFTTAPYTPADGQQAQQTQFIVNNNGNVITNIVSRPDLAPHSSQAPTRQPIGGQSQTNTQSPNNPGTAQPAPNPGQIDSQKPDICKSNPNNIACADLGNADYTDPELPQETRNLSFNPADIFASNGMCPQPKNVRVFNTSVEISYKPLCDIAAGIRAIVILAGVMAALYMVWGEVQNG